MPLKKMMTIGGALTCVFGVGLLMQIGNDNAAFAVQPLSVNQVDTMPLIFPPSKAESALQGVQVTYQKPSVPASPDIPQFLSVTPVQISALQDQPITRMPNEEATPNFSCEAHLGLEASCRVN